MLNLLARAAGYRNHRTLRAAAPNAAKAAIATPAPLSVPAKPAVQKLCLWALWARLLALGSLGERQISARLNALRGFGDAAMLRRDLVGLGLLSRTLDGSAYLRIQQAPPAESQALIRALSAQPCAGSR